MGDPVETRNAWVVGHKTPGQTYHFQGINQGIVTPNMVENSEQNLKPPTRYIEDMGTLYIYIYIWLVVSTPLKNMKVSWDYYSQYMEK